MWEHEFGGVTLDEYVKDTIIAQLASVKAVTLLAKENNVTLSDAEKEKISQAAEEYYSALTDEQKKYMKVEKSGTSLTKGADCSGFTLAVYRNFGISLPHSSRAQANCGTKISVGDVKPGDLIFYGSGKRINHVAMYIGGGRVVHASNARTGITISNMYYRSPVSAARILQD